MTPFKKLLFVAGVGGALMMGTSSFAQEHDIPPSSPHGPHADGAWGGHWEGGHRMGHHRGGEGLAILEHLDLSQAQKDAVIGILNAAKPNLKAIHEDMMKSAMALHELTPDDPKYAAAVTQARIAETWRGLMPPASATPRPRALAAGYSLPSTHPRRGKRQSASELRRQCRDGPVAHRGQRRQ